MLHYRRFILGTVLLLAGAALAPADAQPAPPAQSPAPTAQPPVSPQPAAPAPANAPAGPVYIVTFFEVGAASTNQTMGLLHTFGGATRKEKGNLAFQAMHEVGPAGRFAMIEGWSDQAAAEAHAAAAKGLADRLQTSLASPFDTRPCNPLDIGQPAAQPGPGAGGPGAGGPGAGGPSVGYVLTHVDVVPAHKDETVELLRQLAAASRQERGMLRFDVIQQPNRPNHLFLVEAWSDVNAHNAHVMAPATRDFRAKLLPFQGALYDERIYTPIR